jgi:hypothetical protein
MYLDGDDSRHCMQCGYVQVSTSQTGASARLALLLGFDRNTGHDDKAPAEEVGQSPSVAV